MNSTDQSVLEGKRVILGVTGGIAAYKAVELCRELMNLGAYVIPIMTEEATRFVTENTFSALASEPAHVSLWNDPDPLPHVHLSHRADLALIAPATARFLARYAHGFADDLLISTLLAVTAPVVICPAMHTEMWDHPAVIENLEVLRHRGVNIIEPEQGKLAGGDVGMGRLAPVSAIIAEVVKILAPRSEDKPWSGLKVLVTAGGTREPIDPVRYISNRSSGKQGYALAKEASARGAEVYLVTASNLPPPKVAKVVQVETAAEMEEAVRSLIPRSDVVIMAAAVADFRPTRPRSNKLDKQEGVPLLELEPTTDILSWLGREYPDKVLVGFAAETSDVRDRAARKLEAKGVDVMVANDVTKQGVGFEHDTNEVTVMTNTGEKIFVPLSSKDEIAKVVLDVVHRMLADRQSKKDRGLGNSFMDISS